MTRKTSWEGSVECRAENACFCAFWSTFPVSPAIKAPTCPTVLRRALEFDSCCSRPTSRESL